MTATPREDKPRQELKDKPIDFQIGYLTAAIYNAANIAGLASVHPSCTKEQREQATREADEAVEWVSGEIRRLALSSCATQNHSAAVGNMVTADRNAVLEEVQALVRGEKDAWVRGVGDDGAIAACINIADGIRGLQTAPVPESTLHMENGSGITFKGGDGDRIVSGAAPDPLAGGGKPMAEGATPRTESGDWPTPKHAQEIVFEGRGCVVMAPEEYEALFDHARQLEREADHFFRLSGQYLEQLASASASTRSEALAVLIELHKLLDFDDPWGPGEEVVVDDTGKLNEVFKRAYAAINAPASATTRSDNA